MPRPSAASSRSRAAPAHTEPLGVADGQHKIAWTVGGVTKEKVFRVNCHEGKRDAERRPGDRIEDQQRDGAGWGQSDHNGPKGGVHAGGGGLVDTAAAFAPVTAAGVVGLVAVGGVAYFRMNRRRPNGAA